MPPIKYWEIIADKLSAAGWSWGYCSVVTKARVALGGWRSQEWSPLCRRVGRAVERVLGVGGDAAGAPKVKKIRSS